MANVTGASGGAFTKFTAGASDAVDEVEGLEIAFSGLTGAVKSAAGALATLGTIGVVGTVGAMAAGVTGLGVAFGSAIKQAADFDQQLRGVARTAELSEQEVNKVGNRLLELSTKTPTTTQELAAIAEEAGRLGISGSRNITKFTDTIQKVAVATETQAQTAAQQLAKISNALGRPVSGINELADVINKLSQTAPTSFGEISQAMRKAAAGISQSVQVSGDNLAALTATVTAAGAEAGRTGTRFRRLFEELALPSTKQRIAEIIGKPLEQVNKRLAEKGGTLPLIREFAKELRGIENREQVLQEIFPTSALANLRRLITRIGQLDERVESTANAAGSVQEEFNRSIDTLNEQFNILFGNIKEKAIRIGQPALNTLQQGVMEITDGLQSIDESTVDDLGNISKALAEVSVALGDFTVRSFVKGFEKLEGAVGGLNEELGENAIKKINTLKNEFGTYIQALGPAIPVIGAAAGAFALLGTTAGQATIAITSLTTIGPGLASFLQAAGKGIREFAEIIGLIDTETENAIESLRKLQKERDILKGEEKGQPVDVKGITSGPGQSTKVIKENQKQINKLSKNLNDDLQSAVQNAFENFDKLQSKLEDGVGFKKLIKQNSDLVEKIPKNVGKLLSAATRLEEEGANRAAESLRKQANNVLDAYNEAQRRVIMEEGIDERIIEGLNESGARLKGLKNITVDSGKAIANLSNAMGDLGKFLKNNNFKLEDYKNGLDQADSSQENTGESAKQAKKEIKSMINEMNEIPAVEEAFGDDNAIRQTLQEQVPREVNLSQLSMLEQFKHLLDVQKTAQDGLNEERKRQLSILKQSLSPAKKLVARTQSLAKSNLSEHFKGLKLDNLIEEFKSAEVSSSEVENTISKVRDRIDETRDKQIAGNIDFQKAKTKIKRLQRVLGVLEKRINTTGDKIQASLVTGVEQATNTMTQEFTRLATEGKFAGQRIADSLVSGIVETLNKEIVQKPINNAVRGLLKGAMEGGPDSDDKIWQELGATAVSELTNFFTGGGPIIGTTTTGGPTGTTPNRFGTGGIEAAANGGRFQSGLTLVGERGPELMATEQGGRVMSNREMKQAIQGGNDEQPEINIINKSGEKTETRQRKENGRPITDIIIGEVSKDIRQNGRTAQAMSQSFGLQRQGQRM